MVQTDRTGSRAGQRATREEEDDSEEDERATTSNTGEGAPAQAVSPQPVREGEEPDEDRERVQREGQTQTQQTLTRDEVIDRLSDLQEQEEEISNRENFSQTDLREQFRLNQRIDYYETALEENPRIVRSKSLDEETGVGVTAREEEQLDQFQQRVEENTPYDASDVAVNRTDEGLKFSIEEAAVESLRDRWQFEQSQREPQFEDVAEQITEEGAWPDREPSRSSTTFRRNPGAIQDINRLQERLGNTVLTGEQRQDIQNRIDQLQTRARQPAEYAGGTEIQGQRFSENLPLPERAQDNTVWTAPDGPVERFGRSVSGAFLSRPEGEEVDNIELEDASLPTRAVSGLGTLTSREGFTYIASAFPGGRSPQDVAEERIEEDIRNPSTGAERLGEVVVSSPVGIVATAGAGAAVGAGGRAATVLSGSGRLAQAGRVAGAGATGFYLGSQAQRTQADLEAGRVTQAGGEVLRTAGELGAFGRGLQAFRRYDAPVLGRTSVTQADNTLRRVDDGFVGQGRMEAQTNFVRGPFSQRLGADETGEIATDINYRIAGDDTQADFRGTLTQEIPGSEETTERALEGYSRVLDRNAEGAQTVTEDVVRTRQDGRLFQYFDDFEDTSINRRIDQEQVNQLRRTDDEFIYQDTGESFVNPSQRETGTVADIPVDAQVSRYESFSVADNTDLPPEETFGSSRTLIFRDSDQGVGGAGAAGTGGGDGRTLTVQELGGEPAGGSPVSSRGLYSQTRAAAREAIAPNTGNYEIISGGAGVGVGREAALDVQGDGQRSVNQFGDQGSVQNFQAEGDVSLSRDQVQSQRFSAQGGQMVRTGGVQVQRTGAPNQEFRGSITEQLGETRTEVQGENVDTIRRTPAGNPLRERSRGRERPIGVSDRINNIRSRGRSRTGLGIDLGVGQGQRNFQDQFSFQGTDQIRFQGAETVQVPRLQLRSFQTTRPVTTTGTGRPGRITGRPGLPGFDFGRVNISGEGEVSGRALGARGETDPTYDIISASAVEARTDEQARFDVDDRESLVDKQEQLGAFVRNKPVQAQNLEYGKSETNRREFF